MRFKKALCGIVIAGSVIGMWATSSDAKTHSPVTRSEQISRGHHRVTRKTSRNRYAGYYGGIALHSDKMNLVKSGACDYLTPYLVKYGLPVDTFKAISARESGCARKGVRVANRTDLSTSRFGENFRGSMPKYWAKVCGVSNWQTPGASIELDVKCAAAAFHQVGMRPWR